MAKIKVRTEDEVRDSAKNILGFDINGTRPTMDRVKESMFASIQNYIKDSIVLDLFAGSGSLGIEALSNGASKCYFVDNNKIQKPQLPITQREQGIMFGLGKNLQNNINGFLFEQKQSLQNLTTTLNMNVKPISNSLFNEVNNHNNTNLN